MPRPFPSPNPAPQPHTLFFHFLLTPFITINIRNVHFSCLLIIYPFVDSESPSIICPGDIVQATDPGRYIAIVTWEDPIITENSGKPPTVLVSPESGSDFPAGNSTVLVFAEDEQGNRANCTFNVEVIGTSNESIIPLALLFLFIKKYVIRKRTRAHHNGSLSRLCIPGVQKKRNGGFSVLCELKVLHH